MLAYALAGSVGQAYTPSLSVLRATITKIQICLPSLLAQSIGIRDALPPVEYLMALAIGLVILCMRPMASDHLYSEQREKRF